MESCLLLTKPTRLLGLFLAAGVGGAVVSLGVARLDKYSSLLTASVCTVLFFGGGWVFWRLLRAIQEPVCLTVLPNELIEVNQRTGGRRSWHFSEIRAYRFFPPVKGMANLRLMLRRGDQVSLLVSDLGADILDSRNTEQFALLARAFEVAWQHYQQAAKR